MLEGAKAGDAFLDVHARLAGDFQRRLAAQVQRPAGRAAEEASRHFGRKFAAGVAVGGAAIGVGLYKATRAAARGLQDATAKASALNEQVNKSNAIFGGSSRGIQRWAKGAADSFGQSQRQALAAASSFGDMFLQLKIGRRPATDMSKSMVELASDLASFSDADITQVLEAQQAAFRGEYDSLQRFIPGINAARVEQVALNQTHKQSAKDLTQAEKALATYTIITKDAHRATGDFARTLETSLANQQRQSAAKWEDLEVAIGKRFLPAQLAATRAVNEKLLPTLDQLVKTYGPAVEQTTTRWAESLTSAVPSANQISTGIDGLNLHLDRLRPALTDAWENFRSTRHEADDLAPTLRLSGAALGFVADHADTLARHIPLLVAGFGAYKAAQAAANVAAAAEVVLLPARIAATISLARSNKTLAASYTAVAAASGTATAAQSANTAATAAGAAVAGGATAKTGGLIAKLGIFGTAAAAGAYQGSQWAKALEEAKGRSDPLSRAITWLNEKTTIHIGKTKDSAAATKAATAATEQATPRYKTFGETAQTAGLRALVMGRNAREGIGLIPSKRVSVTATFGFHTPPGVSIHDIVGRAAGGYISGPGTETSDSIPARLSRGEYVVRAKAVKAVGRATMDRINAQGFAAGGPVLDANFPSGQIMVRAALRFEAAIDRIIGRLATKWDRFAGARPPHVPGGWKVATQFLSALGIPYNIISTFRPGARTHASGRQSYHALNRAVDLTGPNMLAIWSALTRTRPTELIYSRAPRYFARGRWKPISALDPITRADHYSHVHAAYDRGGWLQPGLTLAYNGTGRPEPVLPPGGIDYDRLAALVGREVAAELRRNPPQVYLDGRKVTDEVRRQLQSMGYSSGRRSGA